MKKINYKELATSYESLIDVKNKIIEDQEHDVKALKTSVRVLRDIADDCMDEGIEQRKQIFNLKVDRIASLIIIIMLLGFIITLIK